MSATTLTLDEVQQIVAVSAANQGNPAAVWAALAAMGDQYAAAALQGLTNSQSTYGQLIANSNFVSGVSQSQYAAAENNVANGYVALIENAAANGQLNPDGTVNLPTTTQIETNYYNALAATGVSPSATIDLSIAVLAESGMTKGSNWYTLFPGLGLNLDPARWAPPSPDTSDITVAEAGAHFLETFGLTALIAGENIFNPGQFNVGEDEVIGELGVVQSVEQNLVPLANGGVLVDPTLFDGGPAISSLNYSFRTPDGETVDVLTAGGQNAAAGNSASAIIDAAGGNQITLGDNANETVIGIGGEAIIAGTGVNIRVAWLDNGLVSNADSLTLGAGS